MREPGPASFTKERRFAFVTFSSRVTSLLPYRCDGGFERRVEAVTIESLEETVPTNEILESDAHLREGHVDARLVELTIELLEHPRRRHVDVGHRLTLDNNPRGVAFTDDVTDLSTEG